MEIAVVCMHVEWVIGILTKFDFLNKNIPILQVDLLHKVLVIKCTFVNLDLNAVRTWCYINEFLALI